LEQHCRDGERPLSFILRRAVNKNGAKKTVTQLKSSIRLGPLSFGEAFFCFLSELCSYGVGWPALLLQCRTGAFLHVFATHLHQRLGDSLLRDGSLAS
jgi:hypothetical protein